LAWSIAGRLFLVFGWLGGGSEILTNDFDLGAKNVMTSAASPPLQDEVKNLATHSVALLCVY